MSKPGQGWMPGQEPPYAWRVQSIIAEICQRAGLPYDRIGPAMVQGICEGYAINGGEEAYSAIEVLAAAYLFDPANYNGRLNFVERGGPVVAELTSDDLLDDSEGIEQVNRRDPITVPRTLNLNYYDIEGGLTPDKQTSDRSLDTRARGDKSMETTVIMRADDAARLTVITHKVMIEEQRGEVEFKLPDTYAWLTVADCITLRMMLSGLPLYWLKVSSAWALVGASRQSKRRSTVSGRMTLRYSLRLYGPRSRLQMLQMSLASWRWVSVFISLFAFSGDHWYQSGISSWL